MPAADPEALSTAQRPRRPRVLPLDDIEYTLTPHTLQAQVSSRDKAIAAQRQAETVYRLYSSGLRSRSRLQEQKERVQDERRRQELAECTFRPRLETNGSYCRDSPFFERQRQWREKVQAKRRVLTELEQIREEAELAFQPELDAHSRELVRRRSARQRDPAENKERGLSLNDLARIIETDQCFGYPEITSMAAALERDVPAHERLYSMGTKRSPEELRSRSSTGGRSWSTPRSPSHTPRSPVYERLYNESREQQLRHERRVAEADTRIRQQCRIEHAKGWTRRRDALAERARSRQRGDTITDDLDEQFQLEGYGEELDFQLAQLQARDRDSAKSSQPTETVFERLASMTNRSSMTPSQGYRDNDSPRQPAMNRTSARIYESRIRPQLGAGTDLSGDALLQRMSLFVERARERREKLATELRDRELEEMTFRPSLELSKSSGRQYYQRQDTMEERTEDWLEARQRHREQIRAGIDREREGREEQAEEAMRRCLNQLKGVDLRELCEREGANSGRDVLVFPRSDGDVERLAAELGKACMGDPDVQRRGLTDYPHSEEKLQVLDRMGNGSLANACAIVDSVTTHVARMKRASREGARRAQAFSCPAERFLSQ